jgi:hypothetical protein
MKNVAGLPDLHRSIVLSELDFAKIPIMKITHPKRGRATIMPNVESDSIGIIANDDIQITFCREYYYWVVRSTKELNVSFSTKIKGKLNLVDDYNVYKYRIDSQEDLQNFAEYCKNIVSNLKLINVNFLIKRGLLDRVYYGD